MKVDTAFDTFQTTVNADPDQLAEARERRDTFIEVLGEEDDVDKDDSFPSGSLARKTQRAPINDVDVVVVYRPDDHPDWGDPGSSAGDALDHVQGRISDLMGASDGDEVELVRLARPRNHAVKCFIDDPNDPDAFTVDVVPALRQEDGSVLIPESESRIWIPTDPQHLIGLVEKCQDEWNHFIPLVRVLKHWNEQTDTGMKGLTVEVLALDHLRNAGSRSKALLEYFTAAAANIYDGVTDPADLCGDIQPDLNLDAAHRALQDASDAAWDAVNYEADGNNDAAVCKWREVLGSSFPEPPDGCSDDVFNAAAAAAVGTSVSVGSSSPRPIRRAPQG